MKYKYSPLDPAFPLIINRPEGQTVYSGISLRTYIATKCLQGLCVDEYDQNYSDAFADMAVKLADALIERLEKGSKL